MDDNEIAAREREALEASYQGLCRGLSILAGVSGRTPWAPVLWAMAEILQRARNTPADGRPVAHDARSA
jgi:hypothetical protein